jgi:ABC-type transport system substrate-binding protein
LKELMMKMKTTLLFAALALRTRHRRVGPDRARRQPGRRAVDGPALAQRIVAAVGHRQRLRAAGRPRQGPEPGAPLATSWKQVSPTVWRFELRKGVQFHDGTPFTADDVIFSFQRVAGEGSDIKSNVNDIKEVRKVNDYAVDIETKAPFPILPNQLTTTYILSKKWCETNQATRPVDRRKGIENAASFRANGTGPFRLRERQPNVRTTFVRNGNYWGTRSTATRRK